MNRTVFVSFILLPLLFVLVKPREAISDDQGWMGVQVEELDEALKEALDYKGEGVLVKEVFEDSPAGEAGLLAGDIITDYAGKQVEDLSGFVDMVRETDPGSKVKVTVIRKGKKKDFEVEIEEREEPETFRKFGKHFKGLKLYGPRACLGVRLEDLDEDLGEYFKTSEGALVMSVVDESPASSAGIKAGDVIKEIDGSTIHDTDDAVELIRHKQGGDEVDIKVVRKGKEKSIKVTLKECEKHSWFCEGHHGKGRYYLEGYPGGCCAMIPDLELGDLDIDIEDLGEYLSSEDFGKGIEKEIKIIGELDDERIEELEENLKELKEELKEIKEKLKN